jgi:Flp pilus assembly protein CpaB
MDRLRSSLLQHRRLLAALCAGLAVLAGLGALRAPDDTVVVPVASGDLASGQLLAEPDVTTARVPAEAVPDGALHDDELVGRRVGGPMRAGEVFTDARVVVPGAADSLPDGQVVSTVRLPDPTAAQGLRVGDAVDVVATAPDADGPRAEVVAEAARVVALPDPESPDAAGLSVAVPRDTALTLARAALEAQLAVVAVPAEGP